MLPSPVPEWAEELNKEYYKAITKINYLKLIAMVIRVLFKYALRISNYLINGIPVLVKLLIYQL